MEWYVILLILNGIVGLVAFEWAWIQMKPFRNVVKERDEQYPPFRRLDVHLWKKWKFYLGAITLMPIRFILSILSILIVYVLIKFITIGHSIEDGKPVIGCRKWFVRTVYTAGLNFILIMAGVYTKQEIDTEFDYEPYLGPDYRNELEKYPHLPTYICNHVSFLDIIAMIKYYCPAFAAKRPLKDVPVLGILCQYLGCIFIARGATEEQR
jgi:hypothetical protein